MRICYLCKTMTTKQQGQGRNIYFAGDVWSALQAHCKDTGRAASGVVQALVKIYLSMNLTSAQEQEVGSTIKAAIGRRGFMAFLEAVQSCLGGDWQPVLGGSSAGDYQADTWIHSRGELGLVAFFAPHQGNHGRMYDMAFLAKAAHDLKRVIVVIADDQQVPQAIKTDLGRIGVEFGCLVDLKARLQKVK
jgi:hypothetical protein